MSIEINVNNTNFSVVTDDSRVKSVMFDIERHVTTYTFKYDYETKRQKRIPHKIYIAAIPRTSTARLPIKLLKYFMSLLKAHGITKDDLTIIDDRGSLNGVIKTNFKFNKKIKPYGYQKEATTTILDSKHSMMLIDILMGYGKASSNDSLVKVPFGWKRMGDIVIGDIITTTDGGVQVVTGVYPQGKSALYEVKTVDDRSAIVTAEHLWEVTVGDGCISMITDTSNMMKNPGTVYKIPVPKPPLKDVKAVERYGVTSFYIKLVLLLCKVAEKTDIVSSQITAVEHWVDLDKRNFVSSLLGIERIIDFTEYKLPQLIGDYRDTITTIIRSMGGVCRSGLYKGIVFTFGEEKIAISEIKRYSLGEATCISVSSPDRLYITDDYVVTHNTLMSMYTVSKIQERFALLILPKYIDKWISDVGHYLNLEYDEIYVVRGGDSLRTLMENIDVMKEVKCIIFSLRTVSNYIKEYSSPEDEFTYPIVPQDLMRHIGVGTMVNDEAHQEFYAVYMASLYFSVNKWIGLSATLRSNDKNMEQIYSLMYNSDNKISNLVKYVNYINVIAVSYYIKLSARVKYKRQQGYSHTLFEESIMKSSIFLQDYLTMITHWVLEGFNKRREPGDKLIIFAATVRMCTIITNHIAGILPALNVKRYVEEDPYDNVMEGDVIVSTVISAGTALDIPNLTTVLMTISIGSLQANLQSVGRLRDLKNKDMRFYYLYSVDIPEQKKLHNLRREAIKDIAKSYKFTTYTDVVRSF